MQYTIILNRAAGGGRATHRRRRLEEALERAGISGRLLLTEGRGHARELACQAAAAGDAVVAAGGDGTVHEVSAGLLASGKAAHLGIIPIGTGNDFVKLTGIPRGIGPAVAALAAARPRRVDYGRLSWSGPGGEGTSMFINAAGAGFDASVADAAARYKFLPGLAPYLAAALRELPRWVGPEAEVTLGTEAGETTYFRGRLFLCLAGNGRSSGGGFYLTPDASITDGLLDVCVIEAASPVRLLRLLPAALRGRHVGAPEVHVRQARTLRVSTDRPVQLQADGEMLSKGQTTLEAAVVPGGLSLLDVLPTDQ